MILRLGHTELFVTDLEKAREFYVDVLGFREHDSDKQHIYLRGVDEFDTHTLTLTKNSYSGLGHFALRVSDPEDLERLAYHHKKIGNSVYEGTRWCRAGARCFIANRGTERTSD